MSDKPSGEDQHNESLTNSMKRLLVQCAELGKTGIIQGGPLSQEDKEFLEAALESTVEPRHRSNPMSSLIQQLEAFCNDSTRDKPTEDELSALEMLEEITEDMHAGDDFIGLNGIHLCKLLIECKSTEVVMTTCNIIASTSSNNEAFQKRSEQGNNLLKQLFLEIPKRLSQSPSVRAKLLYAASCIISSNPNAIHYILTDADLGLAYIFKLYITNPHIQVRKRLGRIIVVIFRDVPLPKLLKPRESIEFCKFLITSWWADEDSYIFLNLELLYGIFKGQNYAIRHHLQTEFHDDILNIFDRMRQFKESNDTELTVLRDELDGIGTLENFQHDLLMSGPPTPPLLSILQN